VKCVVRKHFLAIGVVLKLKHEAIVVSVWRCLIFLLRVVFVWFLVLVRCLFFCLFAVFAWLNWKINFTQLPIHTVTKFVNDVDLKAYIISGTLILSHFVGMNISFYAINLNYVSLSADSFFFFFFFVLNLYFNLMYLATNFNKWISFIYIYLYICSTYI
jgi:hypothetical protein